MLISIVVKLTKRGKTFFLYNFQQRLTKSKLIQCKLKSKKFGTAKTIAFINRFVQRHLRGAQVVEYRI